MNFNYFLRNFQHLETGAKLAFSGILLACIFAFLPWFQIDQIRAEEGLRITRTPEISNGFGIFPIFGFLSLIFAIGALAVFVQYASGAKKNFGFSHGKTWIFLGGQALFSLLIAVSVFSSEMQNDSTAQIRFGAFLSIFAHALIAFGGYLFEKREKQEQTRAALSAPFSQDMNHLNIRPEEPAISSDQLSLSDAHERKQSVLRR